VYSPRPRHYTHHTQPSPGPYWWRVFFGLPACICISPVSGLYISPYPWYPPASLYVSISSHFGADHRRSTESHTVSHCIQLYPHISSCIQLYLAVSCCISLSPYPPTASKTGYGKKYTPGEGYTLQTTEHPSPKQPSPKLKSAQREPAPPVIWIRQRRRPLF